MQILSAKYLITLFGEPIVDGAVAVENGEIIDVGKEEDLLKRYASASHEDYPNSVIMPGLINCHTHLDMSFYKDYPGDPVRKPTDNTNFIDWLMGCLNYKRRADMVEMRQAVEWGVDECIQSGVTCVADMGNYEGIFAVLEQKGLRAVVFPEVISYDNAVSKDLFESAMAIVEKYQEEDSDLINVGMGPYSPFTLSRNILRILSQFCRSSQIPLMIHAAASFSEMEFFHNSSGDIATKLFPNIGWNDLPPEHQRTPVQHLSQIGFLECSPILVGCTQTTETDLQHIAQSGSKIVLTPRSSCYLKLGKPDFAAMLRHKVLVCLGTDGIPAVDTLSLWDEMRAFVEQYQGEVPLTGHQVLALVTTHAAHALGLGDEIGSIQKGKRADLIVVDVSDISEEGDLLMNLIKGVKNYQVKSVMVNGCNVKSMN